MARPTKILVLRFSSIGDIVLTSPVVRCLKQQLPGLSVHYATKRAYSALIGPNPYIDKGYYLDDSLAALIRQLRAEDYDLVIDLHNNLRTRAVKLALGKPAYTVDKLNWRKWLYVRWKVNCLPDRHIVDRYLDTVAPLGVSNDGGGLDYFIPDADRLSLDQLPATHRYGYVAYAMGGQHATKRLPVSRMIELVQRIDYPVVLLGGAEDREAGAAVEQALGPDRVYNACGLYRFSQSASLVQQARVVFSHDTGLMHVAAAFRKKVYALWGNTTPELGMYPYQTPHVSLQVPNLPCRPCSKIGSARCPQGHFRCMNELNLAVPMPELSHERIA